LTELKKQETSCLPSETLVGWVTLSFFHRSTNVEILHLKTCSMWEISQLNLNIETAQRIQNVVLMLDHQLDAPS
jgi:hypothetical protein